MRLNGKHNKSKLVLCLVLYFVTLHYLCKGWIQFSPICEEYVGEALGFLSALDWVHVLNLGPIDFEFDVKGGAQFYILNA